MKHKTFIFSWVLMLAISIAGLVISPAFQWETKIEGLSIKHEEWLDWRRYLRSGENKAVIKTTIAPLSGEFNFGDGEVYVEIGPMKVEVQSLDMDKDGIKDPVDALKLNNYLFLPILGILYAPASAFIEYVTTKRLKKN